MQSARDSISQNNGYQHGKWHQTWPVHSTSSGHGMSSLDLGWDITQQGRLLNQSIHCQHQQCVAFSLASPPEPLQYGWTYQESKLQLVLPVGSARHASPPPPQMPQSNTTLGWRGWGVGGSPHDHTSVEPRPIITTPDHFILEMPQQRHHGRGPGRVPTRFSCPELCPNMAILNRDLLHHTVQCIILPNFRQIAENLKELKR